MINLFIFHIIVPVIQNAPFVGIKNNFGQNHILYFIVKPKDWNYRVATTRSEV